MLSHVGGPGQKKRGRGRPRKSESRARTVAEVKKEEPPEEEEDDIIDAGALDDQGQWRAVCILYISFPFFKIFFLSGFCIQVTVIISQLMKRPGPDWLPVTALLLLPALHHLPLPHGNGPEG